MKAYICDEGLARFCTTKYEQPTRLNFKKSFMHLTNYSINKMSDDYVKPQKEDILNENSGTKRTMASLRKTIESRGISFDAMWQAITETCERTMAIYAPMIKYNVKMAMEGKDVNSKPFSVLGLDLLIDHKMKAWILEVNDHPSLNIFFDNSKEFFG